MNKQNQIQGQPEALLEVIGGEDLSGSGFENEVPEPDFTESESVPAREER